MASALGIRLAKDDLARLGPLQSDPIGDGIIADDGVLLDAPPEVQSKIMTGFVWRMERPVDCNEPGQGRDCLRLPPAMIKARVFVNDRVTLHCIVPSPGRATKMPLSSISYAAIPARVAGGEGGHL